jgi:hypothetical protein
MILSSNACQLGKSHEALTHALRGASSPLLAGTERSSKGLFAFWRPVAPWSTSHAHEIGAPEVRQPDPNDPRLGAGVDRATSAGKG